MSTLVRDISLIYDLLRLLSDGKQIDPKLIRVVPIVKRVTNVVLKPPSPTRVKRIIGCSWSAFRGKVRMFGYKLYRVYCGYVRTTNYMSD